jgi:hypothetical protein
MCGVESGVYVEKEKNDGGRRRSLAWSQPNVEKKRKSSKY